MGVPTINSAIITIVKTVVIVDKKSFNVSSFLCFSTKSIKFLSFANDVLLWKFFINLMSILLTVSALYSFLYFTLKLFISESTTWMLSKSQSNVKSLKLDKSAESRIVFVEKACKLD